MLLAKVCWQYMCSCTLSSAAQHAATSIVYRYAPGAYSEYLEEFPLGFYWSSIRARAYRSVQFALVEIGELGVGGPIYL